MKPPAFQFYADDFLAGVADMTQAEVGAYILLLCHQWNRGSAPVEPERQQLLAKGSVSEHVLAKFQKQPDGTLKNQRLETERQKQEDYREKQRQKGISSGESRRTASELRFNRGSTVVATGSEPNSQPEANREATLLSPSPSPSPVLKPPTPFQGNGLGILESVSNKTEPKKTWNPTSEQVRLGNLFRRRENNAFSKKEMAAWKSITPIAEEDLKILEKFYIHTKHPPDKDFRKRKLITLLNDFSGALDMARKPEKNCL